MAAFQYKAHGADQTPVEGRLEADDLKAALRSLETQGLIVSSIHQLEDTEANAIAPATTEPEKNSLEAEQLALRKQMTRLLQSAKPLAPALLAYAQELPPGSHRRRLRQMANQLDQGHAPSHELPAAQWDEAWIPLLSASASSGVPSQILGAMIDASQQVGDLRRQFISALAYPLTLSAVSLAILTFMTWWITPTFQLIFADFGISLPAATQWLMTISDTIRKSRGLVVVIPALASAAMIVFCAVGPRLGVRDWIVHHIPVIGAAVRLSDQARFTRHLANLVVAKISVADALRISVRNASHTELRREANRLADEMDVGKANLGDASVAYRSLPRTVVHALQLHENPEAAALILRELSSMYDQQTRNRLAWISSLVEPLFIVLLGTAVGFYVVALFMPLFNLIQNLT